MTATRRQLAGMAVLPLLAVAAIAGIFEIPDWPPDGTDASTAATTTAAQSSETAHSEASQALAADLPARFQNADTAKMELQKLKIQTGTPSGYDRGLFPHWKKAWRYGWPASTDHACTARRAALLRDGQNVHPGEDCKIGAGVWLDPYTGQTLTDASRVDTDHVVPLAEAWRSGANLWDASKRTRYANDPLVLVSVLDTENQAKGDKDPAQWMPPLAESKCLYLYRWVAIKATYQLKVDKAERQAVLEGLAECGR